MAYTQVVIPLAWMSRICIGLIGFAITATILRTEIKNRHSPTINVLSKYLHHTSAVCLWCGAISSLWIVISVIPGFCMIRYIGSILMFYTQYLSLILYQLSRLHYCFSNQQTRTKNGYPLWVFVVMITIGIVIWILSMTLNIFVDTLPSKCGYTNDMTFFYRYRERAILFDGDSFRDEWMDRIYHLWNLAVTISAQFLDLVILLLYLFKIWRIGNIHKSKGDGVWDNVLSILHRIVIITVFYDVCFLFLSALYNISVFVSFSENMMNSILYEVRTSGAIVCCNVLWSFSLYLMMDHNTEIYVVFLHFLRRFRLKYCCFCCFHKMVDQQIERFRASGSNAKDVKRQTGTSTMFPNLSKHDVYKSNAPPVELSCATVTHIVYDDAPQ